MSTETTFGRLPLRKPFIFLGADSPNGTYVKVSMTGYLPVDAPAGAGERRTAVHAQVLPVEDDDVPTAAERARASSPAVKDDPRHVRYEAQHITAEDVDAVRRVEAESAAGELEPSLFEGEHFDAALAPAAPLDGISDTVVDLAFYVCKGKGSKNTPQRIRDMGRAILRRLKPELLAEADPEQAAEAAGRA